MEPIGEPDCTSRRGCRWAPDCFDGTCPEAHSEQIPATQEPLPARLHRLERELTEERQHHSAALIRLQQALSERNRAEDQVVLLQRLLDAKEAS
jgi:hypothetical protein